MLKDLRQLIGDRLGATDGEIGQVKDFYFDDQSWMVRYLVADTGGWLGGRQVLLAPNAFGARPFGKVVASDKVLNVELTRKKIEDSPSIDAHRPVSRQHEESYYQYYGWPGYWPVEPVTGAGAAPLFPPMSPEPKTLHHGHNQRDDQHLRSVQAIKGYLIRATDGVLGKVAGFLVDDRTWRIREMAVETGHWYSGKEILVLPENIEKISHAESTVFVNLTKAVLENTARHDVAQVGA
jgi:hypothetical protein